MSEQSAFEASLGFHIRYPELQRGDLNQNETGCSQGILNQDIESKGDQKSIVIVLLGWFGAEYKYLSKYSEIYLQKGCIVLECITPVKYLTVHKCKLPMVAQRVLSILEEYHLIYNPIFFHAFSDAGAWVYSYVIKELGTLSKSKELDIKGTIFDSAPFPVSAFTVYKAMVAYFSSFYFFLIKYPMALGIASLWMLDTFWEYNKLSLKVCYNGDRYDKSNFSGEQEKNQEPFPLYNWLPRVCALRNHAFLFLYSETDDITPWEHLEAVAGNLQNRGNYVMLVKFEGSKHVEHYRSFPQEYVADIWSFILKEMDAYDRPTVCWD